MAAQPISLKLLVDKGQNQVVYAESDNDFVDVLLSFLTMPIGTIVRLVGKQSKIGCMSTLYEAVEDLDMRFLQTEACKQMLLHPRNASEEWCKNLRVNIDDTKSTKYYACSRQCCVKVNQLTSTANTARCLCGKMMAMKFYKDRLEGIGSGENGVFLKGNARFMITDDLQISPASTTTSITVLNKLGISDTAALEERDVNVGAEEVLDLLKRLLLSKAPLTEVFLRSRDTIDGVDLDFKVMSLDSKHMAQSLTENESGNDSKKMSVKLFVSKSNNKVLYAEHGTAFPDLLFSFLAFPLGSVVKVLGGFTGMVCLNNLYNSAKLLSLDNSIMSEECEDMLLDPKIAPYFSCDVQPLQIQEQVPWQPTIFYCSYCDNDDWRYIRERGYRTCETCGRRCKEVQLSTINPKYSNSVKELGGAFTAGPAAFMVTDELNVRPVSPILGISVLNKLNVSISDLEEHIVNVGEEEALALLKASLISNTALNDVFGLKKRNQSAVRGSYRRRPGSARNLLT